MSSGPKESQLSIALGIKQSKPSHHPNFDDLPNSAFVREAQLIQSTSNPNIAAPLPFSAPSLWRKVKAGTFPRPVRLSAGMTCWKVSEVRAWMADMSAQEYLPAPPLKGKKKKPVAPTKKEAT